MRSIKGVVSKWAALKWLNHQAALAPIPAKLLGGNQRYAVGDLVEVEFAGAKYPHLTLFNLPPDGRVELALNLTFTDANGGTRLVTGVVVANTEIVNVGCA